MTMTNIVTIIEALAWPSVVLVIVLLFRKPVVSLFSRAQSVDIKANGIQLVLSKMEELDPIRRKELSGLSSNEIWLLNDIDLKKISPDIKAMIAPQKVGVATLLEMKLLETKTVGSSRHVVLTKLGKELLDIAKNII
ncbi:MAG: hypothetical protein IMF18_02340 [Proteobacteria bacterium]|nr:hypothetical protein [Pseudomonadota bacterium]